MAKFPAWCSAILVGVKWASWREMRLMESETKGGSDGSAGNACALGTWNYVHEAAAAGLKIFYGPWFGGIGPTAVRFVSVRAS